MFLRSHYRGERSNMPISRRDILKSLTITAITGSVLRVIPLEAAEYAHRMVRAEKAAAEGQVYAPKFFSAHFYKTLQSLCQTIIPSDADSKGALEAGAPDFIDLITSENKDYQVALGGGLMWLDKGYAEKSNEIVWIKIVPETDVLRSDPRYAALLKKMNFPQ